MLRLARSFRWNSIIWHRRCCSSASTASISLDSTRHSRNGCKPAQLLCSPQHCGLTDSCEPPGWSRRDIQRVAVVESVICCCMTDNEALGSDCFGGRRTPFMRGGEAAVSGSTSGTVGFKSIRRRLHLSVALRPGQALGAGIYGSVRHRGVRGDRSVAVGEREPPGKAVVLEPCRQWR